MADQILPGLYHWTAFHPGIGARVSSYYVEDAAALIDPKLPDEGWEALPGAPQQILLTSGHHGRDAGEISGRLGIPIRASQAAADHLGGELEVEVFADDAVVADGITALQIGVLCPDEGAFRLAIGGGVIALADALTRHGEKLGFFRDSLLGENPEEIKQGLARRFAGLLERDFDHLLLAHAAPVIGGAKQQLTELVDAVLARS